MKDLFEVELRKLYDQDIKDIVKEYELLTKKLEKHLGPLENKLNESNKELNKLKEENISHLNMSKEDKKKDKKAWKNKKKHFKSQISEQSIENAVIKRNYDNVVNELSKVSSNLEADKQKLANHLITIHETAKRSDYEIISGMAITCLATKIKIVIKEVKQVEIPSNPRVGMSIGSNFKPRVYMSTNAKKRYKNVVTRNDQYDIRKKDNLEERIIELSEILNIQNPYNLYEHIVRFSKQSVGSQYLKEFGN